MNAESDLTIPGILAHTTAVRLDDHVAEDNRRFDHLDTALARLQARLDHAQIAWWGAVIAGLGTLVITLLQVMLRHP